MRYEQGPQERGRLLGRNPVRIYEKRNPEGSLSFYILCLVVFISMKRTQTSSIGPGHHFMQLGVQGNYFSRYIV